MKYIICSIAFSVLGSSVATAVSKVQACALDLCGPIDKYSSYGNNGNNMPVSKEVTKFIDGKFNTALSEALDIDVANSSAQIKYLQAATRPEADGSFTIQQKSVLLGLYLETKYPDLEDNAVKDEKGNFDISPDALAQMTPGISETERELIHKYLVLKMSSDSYQAAKLTSMFTYESFFKLLYGIDTQSEPEKVSAYITGMQTVASALNQKLGEALMSSRHVKFLAAVAKVKNLSNYQKTYLMEVLTQVMELAAYTDSGALGILAVADQYPLDVAEVLKYLSDSLLLEDFAKTASEKDSVSRNKAHSFDVCSSIVMGSLAAAPSKLRSIQFRDLQAKVKAAGQRAATRYFSGEALKAVQNAIAITRIVPVDNLDELGERVDTMLKRQRLNAVEVRRHMGLASKSELQATSLLLASIRKLMKIQDGIFKPINDNCKKLVMNDFSDQAYSNIGIIETSWQSGTFLDTGAGILSHEIGHVVDAVIKNGKFVGAEVAGFSDAKTCEIEAQKPIMKMYKRPETDANNYVSEDWADTFANSTMTELKKDWPYTTNFACSIIAGFWYYLDTDDLRALGGPVHSPVLLRALKIQISRGGKIPASCTSMLPAKGRNQILQTCEK